MGIEQQRTFIVKKWFDDSLNIEKKDKAYRGKRIRVEAFGALPYKDGIWILAARLEGQKVKQFSQGYSVLKVSRLVAKLNHKLAK